jgi:membrane protease YdiL (CAAX protease family)
VETQPRAAGEPGTEAPVRWGIGDALLGTVLTLVVPLVVGVVVLVVTGRKDFEDIPLWGTALLQIPLWAGLLGAPLWATMRKGRRSLVKDFGLRMRWTDIPLGVAVGLTAQFALGLVVTVFYELVGIDTGEVGKAAEALTDTATDAIGVILLILVVAVAAPVLEELFWRGLWLRALERRFGAVVAVVGSSLLFGAIHFQPYDFPALAGFGVVAAVLTMVTGRLGPAIWAHVAFNTTAVISLLLATQLGPR